MECGNYVIVLYVSLVKNRIYVYLSSFMSVYLFCVVKIQVIVIFVIQLNV